ncbi:dihydroxyacetone kinase subunit DhaK [Sinorhizobium alkalisoli]|uniref:dihydroxyacetone kinase subunit DhaK n=1 Tax=Sinorhizobium alkalisoli TaxID=1752398 RepID=UPI00124F26B7|nr:dihydroxyacetone kinase subunit DhaK [Sinorhizobium alkalisoli]MCG5480914.1 dihydroxyacetone kinase subunit DhaK [Sinorhizobium alkalisoli]QFI70049.1 Phosphoenolpyruvate-dihydroxyacetone phosphotransferase [Sinorhizobium alkalisoli]
MKKFMNRAETLVAESLAGFVAAHERLVAFGAERKFVRRRTLRRGKVALISGGGAGHEPMHVGFVGKGMLDAACTGHVFTSPTPDQIIAAIRETDGGEGCLLIVKNYDGDVMNFEMAAELAAAEHRIATVVVRDDVNPSGSKRSQGRRGVAGTLVVEKLLGAAAEAGWRLEELSALGDDLNARIRTMGVALGGVTVPDTERETFVLDEDEMEMGVGIHGEPGRARVNFATADQIVETMLEAILSDLAPDGGDKLLLFINGFGGTPVSELYLAYNAARARFARLGVTVARSLVGTYVTSLDMAGLSITVARLDERELSLWDAPVDTAALRWRS